MTDPFIINDYFTLLCSTLKKLDLFSKTNRFWNMDETSVCTDPSKTKIVGQKGKPCSRTTGGSGEENITCLAAASANGQKVPPLIIFKGINVWSSWLPDESKGEETCPGMAYAASQNGWITSDIFYNYIEKTLIPAIGLERPILLLYDGHTTHVTNNVVELAVQNNLTILKLPPHTSHLLQPLDLSVFKSLKVQWDQKLCTWQRQHTGMRIPKKQFAMLLGEVWNRVNPDIIANGFRKAGICPFDRTVVPTEKYDPQALKRWEDFQKSKETEEMQQPHQNPSVSFENLPEIEQPHENPLVSIENLQETEQLHENHLVSFENLLLATVKQSHSETQKLKKRVADGAEVITSKEAIQRRAEIEKEKEKKMNEKKMKEKRKEVQKRRISKSQKTAGAKKRGARKKRILIESDSSDSILSEPIYVDTDMDEDSDWYENETLKDANINIEREMSVDTNGTNENHNLDNVEYNEQMEIEDDKILTSLEDTSSTLGNTLAQFALDSSF